MRADAAPSTQALRGWQRRALVKYLAAKPRDFLAVATPGSGKTTFALRIAAELLAERHRGPGHRRGAHRTPQGAVGAAAARMGIALDPKFSNSNAQTSSEYHGVVVTYAQVASHPTRHRVRTENRRTLVIFDEIHHGGDAKSWGEAIREAFDDATRRLALTGTPFRSDDSAIPFVTYEPDADGLKRSRPITPTATPRRWPTAWCGRWCSWPIRVRPAGVTAPARSTRHAWASRSTPSRPPGHGAPH